jgi:hypothetical protein
MSHSDIIIIVVTLTISSTLGVYAAVNVIKKYTRPIENVLQRPISDIEIGGNRYVRTQDYPDLLVEPSRIYERFSTYPPSYFTGNPPEYPYLDRYFINSNFENSINFSWIILVILVFLVFLISLVYLNKNPNNFPIFSNDISTQEITYTSKYQVIHKEKKLITYGNYYTYILFSNWTIFDIKEWMGTFDDIDYAVTIELIGESYPPDFNYNNPRLILSWEFIVNKGSSPVLISTHIKKQSDKLIDLFDLEFNNDYSGDKPNISISFTELYYSK